MDVKKIYTVLLRAAASASAGILVLLFVTTILNSRVSSSQNHYFDIAIGFILATEGLIIMDRLLNRKVPWFSRFRLRLVMQVSLSITWLFSISIVLFFKSYDNILSEEINTRGFILSIIFWNSISFYDQLRTCNKNLS